MKLSSLTYKETQLPAVLYSPILIAAPSLSKTNDPLSTAKEIFWWQPRHQKYFVCSGCIPWKKYKKVEVTIHIPYMYIDPSWCIIWSKIDYYWTWEVLPPGFWMNRYGQAYCEHFLCATVKLYKQAYYSPDSQQRYSDPTRQKSQWLQFLWASFSRDKKCPYPAESDTACHGQYHNRL